MLIKHKDEWPVLVDVARKHYLDPDQTVILLASREAADGGSGFEFRHIGALDKTLEAQATLTARQIRDKDWAYQNYVKSLKPTDYKQDFIEYYGGAEAYKLKRYADLIIEEFLHKETKDVADPGIAEVCEEDIE